MAAKKAKKVAKKPKPKLGRPVEDVPQDMADEVAEWIADGKTMREFCRQKGRPCRQTIDKWKAKDEAFRSRIARAREDGHDVLAEDLIELVRTKGMDGLELQRIKIEIDLTLKLLAKWDSGRYGDRVVLAGDKDAPLVLTDTERATRLEALLEGVRRRVEDGSHDE